MVFDSERAHGPSRPDADGSQTSTQPLDYRAKVVHADGTVDYIDEGALGGEVDVMPDGYFKSTQFIGTVIAQCLANVCAYLSWVLPANTLTLINKDLGNSPDIAWASTIYIMGSSIGFLLVGRLSDLFGRKWMVLTTTTLSLAGCVLGGAARNAAMLIVGMGFSGLGAAGQLSFGIVLGELVPNRRRGPVISLVFFTSFPFAVFGPVIARSLIENTAAGWRWSFYLGVILNAVTLFLFALLYHPPTFGQLHVGTTRLRQMRQLDWLGILLYVAGCVLFLVGLSWGGSTYPWASVQVLCPLLIGIATVALFFVYESKWCPVQPLMPPRMFRNVGFDAVIAIATVGAMLYYTFTVLWPTVIATVYRQDSMSVGWQSAVVGGGVLTGQLMAGFAISHVPRVKLQVVAASLCILAFVTALGFMEPHRWAATIALGVVACAAVGYLENISYPGVTLLWEPQDIGLATGVLGSIRGLGGAVAQAIYSSIYRNQLQRYLGVYVVPAALGAGLPRASLPDVLDAVVAEANVSTVAGVTDRVADAVSGAAVSANTEAFKVVFLATVPFSIIVLAWSFLVPDFEKYLTQNVAKRLQDTQFRKEARATPV